MIEQFLQCYMEESKHYEEPQEHFFPLDKEVCIQVIESLCSMISCGQELAIKAMMKYHGFVDFLILLLKIFEQKITFYCAFTNDIADRELYELVDEIQKMGQLICEILSNNFIQYSFIQHGVLRKLENCINQLAQIQSCTERDDMIRFCIVALAHLILHKDSSDEFIDKILKETNLSYYILQELPLVQDRKFVQESSSELGELYAQLSATDDPWCIEQLIDRGLVDVSFYLCYVFRANREILLSFLQTIQNMVVIFKRENITPQIVTKMEAKLFKPLIIFGSSDASGNLQNMTGQQVLDQLEEFYIGDEVVIEAIDCINCYYDSDQFEYDELDFDTAYNAQQNQNQSAQQPQQIVFNI
ncbi:hypothetical protein FGO68_gene13353 [Halteria grandinella]|uniref:Uncharacterized protein n=1 Tax=Halteria grandinella TaxID=5974 RepID=A0A8J8NFN4_HALGN|nr:hypothetical protein FGO68_gene13353 [Halteria grandinella]